MPHNEWTPELHETRIVGMLAAGPLTQKGVLGGLAHWWTRNDCLDGLVRLVERGEVVEIDGRRTRRFALKAQLDYSTSLALLVRGRRSSPLLSESRRARRNQHGLRQPVLQRGQRSPGTSALAGGWRSSALQRHDHDLPLIE